jgi:G patch domain-containing protein 1
MGWRVGNGIGPRVSLKQRRLQDLQTSSPYGTRAAIDDVKITEDDEEANKHTYASRDTPVLIIERKDNFHGLGYRSGMTLNESLGSSKADSGKGPRIAGKFTSKIIRFVFIFWPAGFGLGALNDADEDDLDVYDADISKIRNNLAYDAHHDDTLVLGNKGKSSRHEMVSRPFLMFYDFSFSCI